MQTSTFPPTRLADKERAHHRRERIESWRKMLSSAEHEYRNIPSSDSKPSFSEVLERRTEYLSLKPHLSVKTLEAFSNEKADEAIYLVDMGRRTVINPADEFVDMLIAEIFRIEAEWDLV